MSSAATPSFSQFSNLGSVELIAGWENSLVDHFAAETEYMTFGDGTSGERLRTWSPANGQGNAYKLKAASRLYDQLTQTGQIHYAAEGLFNSSNYVRFYSGDTDPWGAPQSYGAMQSTITQGEPNADPYTTGSAGSGFSVAFVFRFDKAPGAHQYEANKYLLSWGGLGGFSFKSGDNGDPNVFHWIVGGVSSSLPSGSIETETEYLALLSYDRTAQTIDCWIGRSITGSQGTTVPESHIGGAALLTTASIGYFHSEFYTDEQPSQAGLQAPSRLQTNNLYVREMGFYNRPMDNDMVTRMFDYTALTYEIDN